MSGSKIRPSALSLIMSWPLVTLAQHDEFKDLLEKSLEELTTIRITGSTLTDESLRTVPAAVTVFTHDQILKMGYDYLQELINLVPGYQSERNSVYPFGYPMSSRGRRNGTVSKEILLLLDGHPMNSPQSGALDETILLFPLQQIDRVEVIRGPGSAVYGSNAYAGVINIISRSGEREAGLAAGNNDSGNGFALWTGYSGDFQMDFFAQAATDDGQLYTVDDKFESGRVTTSDPRRLVNTDVTLRYRSTELRAQYRRNEGDDFYSGSAVSNGFNSFEGQLAQVDLTHSFSLTPYSHSDLSIGYARNSLHVDAQVTAPGELSAVSTPSTNEPVFGKSEFQSDVTRFRWHNEWLKSELSNIQFGIEWRQERQRKATSNSNFDVSQLSRNTFPVTYYGNFDNAFPLLTHESRRVLGAYGQYIYNWSTSTHVTLGIRYDDYSSIGSHVSPRAALVHELNSIHVFKVLYGEAFRAPGMDETNLANNTIVRGNTNLDHETVSTWDLIWLATWPRTYFSIGWFENHYSSPIVEVQSGTSRAYINGLDEYSQGLELEVRQAVTDDWTLRGGATHFTKLPDSAHREADTLASFLVNFQRWPWNWNLTAVYHGERQMLTPGNVRLELDDYWVLHTKAIYQFASQWRTYVQIKNLLDEDYVTPANGNTLNEGIPNRAREWSIGLEITL